jgi:hypothetical protein
VAMFSPISDKRRYRKYAVKADVVRQHFYTQIISNWVHYWNNTTTPRTALYADKRTPRVTQAAPLVLNIVEDPITTLPKSSLNF